MRDFRELKVWVRAHSLVLSIYKATSEFPREELFGLTGQIRRASVSIAANIAEGCGRSGDVELARFLTIGMGSASELEYLLLLARDLSLISGTDYERLNGELAELKKLLVVFTQKLRANS